MLDYDLFDGYKKACIMMKKPFTITMSNYTAKINSEFINYNSMEEEKSKNFFVASAMVKRDVKDKPVPTIDKSEIRYFAFNVDENLNLDNIYGIDLKNAYATILEKEGFISKKTLFYINQLDKLDRLGALGMLAGKKIIINYDEKGVPIGNPIFKTKDTENYFYFAVKRTSEIMNEMRKMIGIDYLFTWVDCIYFKSEENLKKLGDFLSDNEFLYHEKKYLKFKTKPTKNGKNIRITMLEEKEDKKVLKIFHAPTKQKKLMDDLCFIIDKFANKKK